MKDDGALTVHVQEFRRGTVVLACLAMLDEPGYGYALLEALEAAGFDVDGNTLYPLLRRMEKPRPAEQRVEHRRVPSSQVLPNQP